MGNKFLNCLFYSVSEWVALSSPICRPASVSSPLVSTYYDVLDQKTNMLEDFLIGTVLKTLSVFERVWKTFKSSVVASQVPQPTQVSWRIWLSFSSWRVWKLCWQLQSIFHGDSWCQGVEVLGKIVNIFVSQSVFRSLNKHSWFNICFNWHLYNSKIIKIFQTNSC